MRRIGEDWVLMSVPITLFTLEKPEPAHIRWFVDKGEHVGAHYPADSINLLIIAGAILFIALAFAIDNTSWSHKFAVISEKTYGLFPRGVEWRIIASFLGVLFIINSITGVFLASHLVLPGEGLVIFGGITQMVIGLVLVSQISHQVRVFGINPSPTLTDRIVTLSKGIVRGKF